MILLEIRVDQIFGHIFKHKMNLLITFLFIFVAFALGEDKGVELDEVVLVLTDENFDTTISDTEYILVEFYAPWCGHCKSLAPEYEKAAKTLDDEESKIKLAKVDATVEESLAERFKIKGFPTLKYFRKGNPIDYNGGRTANEIVEWVKKKAEPAAKELKNVAEVKNLLKENDVIAIGFFKDLSSEDAKVFLEAADSVDDFPLAMTSDKKIFKEYSAKDGVIILFRKFDTPRVQFEDELNVTKLKKFLATESLPLLIEFSMDTVKRFLSGDIKTYLLLFLSKSHQDTSKIKETAQSVAKTFRNKIMFISIDTDQNDSKKMMDLVKVKDEELPTMRILIITDGVTKYKPSTNKFTESTINDFAQNYLDGNLEPYLSSQDLPEDWNKGSVYTLVSSNFESVALDPTKHVLVEFYAPWCGHCKKLEPIYEEVGKHFENDDDIIIAKIDATENESEYTEVKGFPTLKLFRKGDNEIIEYDGDRTLEGITKFVKSEGMAMKDEL